MSREAAVSSRRFANAFPLDYPALRLTGRSMLRLLRGRTLSFWFTFLYIFFEYVRPQSIYTSLDFAPWSQIFITGAAIFVTLEGKARITAKALAFSVLGFTAVILASSATAVNSSVSFSFLNEWINWLLLMYVVGAGVKGRDELLLQLVGFMLWNLKMSQHGLRSWAAAGFRFRNWGVTGAPGWFQNSGEFGIEMCVFLPIVGFFTYAVWPHVSKATRLLLIGIVISALISVVGSSSRGALLGVAAVGLWLVIRSPRRLQGIVLLAAIALLVAFFLPEESISRFREMGDDKTSTSRLQYWRDAFEIAARYPFLGIGYKNWISYYRANYNPLGELPHNFLIEGMAELGYTGLVCLICILIAFFVTTANARRKLDPKSSSEHRLLWSMALGLDGAMIGFIVSGSFVTVLFYPYLWMNVALALAIHRVACSRANAQIRSSSTGKFFGLRRASSAGRSDRGYRRASGA